MAKSVTLIFDIGKTNKKLFLFDEELNEIENEYVSFDEIPDDEGFLSEDLMALCNWVKRSTSRFLDHPEYEVKTINFSSYGASLVHLDIEGNVVAPFYNYLKPFPEDLKTVFLQQYYNSDEQFSLNTASPFMGFLNSGLQLYYLKYRKSEVFEKVHQSLHLPQYLSYLLTGELTSDYTSLGCHTGLWDFKNNTYANWVKEEGLEKYFPPIQETSSLYSTKINARSIDVGIGAHDSSTALIPYIQSATDPFVLVSTGTWSVCMNPFNQQELTSSELEKDCLNFLGTRGDSIKASRLFLGQELEEQTKLLGTHFNCDYHRYKSVTYNSDFSSLTLEVSDLKYKYLYLNPVRFGFNEPESTDYSQFESFDQGYHQLVYELTEIQITSLKQAIGNTQIKIIYIDGGFSSNQVFVKMLTKKLPGYKVHSKQSENGSALGAAMLISEKQK